MRESLLSASGKVHPHVLHAATGRLSTAVVDTHMYVVNGVLTVWTDGSAKTDGYGCSTAGFGVFFATNHSANTAVRATGTCVA